MAGEERPGALTVWCNLPLTQVAHAALIAGLGPHRLVQATEVAGKNQCLGRHDPHLPQAHIAFGQPEPDQCAASEHLRWVHISSAGYTPFADHRTRAQLIARGIPVTTSSAIYDEPCAQHALAFMLAEARQLPRSTRDQHAGHAWSTAPTRAASFLLKGQTILLVGYGAIAKRLAELLAPFHVVVRGFRRHPRGDEPDPVLPIVELDAWLARADFVVDILPAAQDTTGFFDARRFAAMKAGAIFLNLGRGTTVDQEALLLSLHDRLRAAYLDVTVPEPLPPDHPLWSERNCFITPHVAGGHGDEYERLVDYFLANLRRFTTGQNLAGRVY
jgi:phosphoglycerate dehydrogenase-like enzyme